MMRKKVLVSVILLMILLGFVLLSISCVNSNASDGDEVNALKKFDPTLYYTKEDIDAMMADYYTQTETDNLLSFSLADYYTQTETDNFLSQYYQQTEVDTLISKNKSSILSTLFDVSTGSGGGPYYWQHFRNSIREEETAALMVPTNGTLKNLCVKSVSGGALPAGTVAEILLRVNYADTPLKVVYTEADGTSLKINTSSVSVIIGDMVAIQTTATVSTAYSQYLIISYLFDAEE
ncbi:MAG: hypothetical protein ACXAC2_05630 [Candidatus Kariarchaeaceae archaeon]|jgi:hypothetical protein